MYRYLERVKGENMKKRKIIVSLTIIIIALLAVVLGAVIISKPYVNDKNGVSQQNKEISYEVVLNYTSDSVASDLEKSGVVKSGKYFSRWLRKNYPDFEYSLGIFTLNTNMSYEQMVTAFKNPTVDRSLVKVCIPEGKRVVDIAKALEENGVCSAESFINSQNKDDFDYDFVRKIDNVESRGYRLEGYLFPATYDLQKNTEAHKVVDDMLLAFSYRVQSNGWEEKCKRLGITLDEAITMGSIIEAEASGASDEDMGNVSGVFWNRIKSPAFTMLQSDPTVFYADLLEEKGFSKSIWKGYTTYSCKGLPTGAINCPGEKTVNAALSPSKSNYYYFFSVSDKTGCSKYVFATDYDEFESLAIAAGVM